MQQQTKILFASAVVVILLLGTYLLFSNKLSVKPAVVPANTATTTDLKPQSGVTLKQSESTAAGNALKLPTGFPTTIPVELKTVTESYSAYYEKQKFTQYTVSYTSELTVGEKWDEYDAYMINAGYNILKTETVKARGVLSGMKDQDNLSIVIVKENNKTTVHLTLLKQG